MLRVSERDGAVSLSVEPAVALSAAVDLGADVRRVTRELREREVLPRCVVLRGSGGGFWLSPPHDARDLDALGDAWRSAVEAVAGIEAPTVAVIEADAIGPAWDLALACDLRICADDVLLGNPEIHWARMSASGGTQRVARLVGQGGALWLLLRGAILTGAEARDLGLVQRAVPRESIGACVADVVDRLCASAPLSLAYAKEAARAGVEMDLAAGMRLEADLAALLQTTADRTEGLSAFLARRAPRFEGR